MKPSLTEDPLQSVPHGQPGDPLSPEKVQEQSDKIVGSTVFRDAEGLKRFLRYTVEHTLRGEGDELKEYRVGVDVFDRSASFDPRLDPVVRMAARRLRTKLREYYQAEGKADLIRIEVPKGGYGATFTSSPHLQPDASNNSPKRRPSWLNPPAFGMLLLAALIAVYWIRSVRQTPVAKSFQEPSIAVLPFLNLTGNQEDEYLSDGLTDELTGALSRLSGWRVIARTSAFKFKGKAEDVRLIGSQLSVASLIEGSLQKSGNQLRITVQLVRTSDGSHIWAETYDRNAKDIFALEDDVTQAITRVLGGHMTLRQSAVQEAGVNAEAHDLYLRGRYWWNRRTPPAVWKSIAYFNQALEKEPLYAEAYLGLADAYTVLGFNDQAQANEVVPKARAAAEQALNLDDSLSEAHTDLAAALFYHDWDFNRSEQEFRRALQLNPNHATAHQWYGLQLMFQRKFDRALQEFSQAQRLDPLSLMIALDIGQVGYYSGHPEVAVHESQKVLTQDPDFAMAHDLLGMAYARQKRSAEALGEFQTYLKLSGGDPDAQMRLALAYADSGKRGQALALAKNIENIPSGAYVPSFDLATIYAALDEKDLAFEWVGRAISEHASSCLIFAIDPAFETLRSDPRYEKDLQKISILPRQ
jgi:TolB-like protein/Flp pilus assembly protein TadD